MEQWNDAPFVHFILELLLDLMLSPLNPSGVHVLKGDFHEPTGLEIIY